MSLRSKAVAFLVFATAGQVAVHFTPLEVLPSVAASLAIGLLSLLVLDGAVTRPVTSLSRSVAAIGAGGETTERLDSARADAIGDIADEFDRLLDRLVDAQAQGLRSARLAGMSELLTGLLHNVGNVLNSVNVSANMVVKEVEKLSVGDLEGVVAVLREHEADLGAFFARDPRAAHLVPLLQEVGSSLAAQRTNIRVELQSLASGIEHIRELVRAQQSYGRGSAGGATVGVSLGEELDGAVRICAQALKGFDGVDLVREYEDLGDVLVDKHKLKEILVNLVQNAHQSLIASSRSDRRIVLRIRGRVGRARIEVEDNGSGIAAENLERVFHHGFTTKKEGNGFGLHVSAKAAGELGGELTASSEGEGRGAVFVLEIPMADERAVAA